MGSSNTKGYLVGTYEQKVLMCLDEFQWVFCKGCFLFDNDAWQSLINACRRDTCKRFPPRANSSDRSGRCKLSGSHLAVVSSLVMNH